MSAGWASVFWKTFKHEGHQAHKGEDLHFCAPFPFVTFVYFVFSKFFSQDFDAHPNERWSLIFCSGMFFFRVVQYTKICLVNVEITCNN